MTTAMWVLVVVLGIAKGQSGSVAFQEFTSKEHCEAVRDIVKKEAARVQHASCVEK